jgi:hypothetical protein
MKIALPGPRPHRVRLTYVTDAPSWKPSYRIVVGKDHGVELQGWAIVDNTSGENWQNVKLGVGASSAMSFRFDLKSIRSVQRETLQDNALFAQAPPMGGSVYGNNARDAAGRQIVGDFSDDTIAANDKKLMVEPRSAGSGLHTLVTESSATAAPTTTATPPPPPNGTWAQGDPLSAGGMGPNGGSGNADAPDALAGMALALRSSNQSVVIEGYASAADADKNGASLDRANRVREQLVREGVDPNRIVAIGKGRSAVARRACASSRRRTGKTKGKRRRPRRRPSRRTRRPPRNRSARRASSRRSR